MEHVGVAWDTMVDLPGATIHKLDSAGRLKLRDHHREELTPVVVLACGFDNCINLFVPHAWNLYRQQFARVDGGSLDPDLHDLRRLLVATAVECNIDDQSRVRIPESLLRWAGLDDSDREAQVICLDDRYEIWEVGRYNEFLTERGRELKEIARQLFGGQARGGPSGEGSTS